MYFFVYDSTKHAWVYKTYIYIKDAPDINMLKCFFFFGCLFLLNQIPAPDDDPDDFLQTVFLRALYQHQMFNYTDIFMVKQDPWLRIMFFSSWIHGNKQTHLNNTQYQVWFLFHLLNRICCRNDSKSVHISVVRSVCTIMCLWPSLCMFWLYCLVNKILIKKKKLLKKKKK